MASSYSIGSKNSYDGRGMTVSCTQSRNISSNKSTINWTLSVHGGNSGYYSTGPTDVWIAGQHVYHADRKSWNSYQFPASTGSVSGSITVDHDSQGNKSVGVSISTAIFTASVTTNEGTWTLDSIPRQASLTSAVDFNDEQNPTIKFSNPGGFKINARLEFAGTNINKENISNTGAYTFNFTDAERKLLRQKCTGNSMTVREVIATCIGSANETHWSFVDKTMTIVNGNPTFSSSNISYKDSNSNISAITGNNQRIVQNRSNLQVTVGSATAKKESSISSYEITFNNVTKKLTSPGTVDFGVINLNQNANVSVKVTDSRGNAVTSSKTIVIDAWVLPTALINSGRINNYEDDTKIKATVTYSSVNKKNSIQTLRFRYKKSGNSTWSSYIDLVNDTEKLITIDKQFIYDIQLEVKDKFGTTTYNFIIPKGVAILYIDTKNQSVGVNCFPEQKNTLAIDGYDFKKLYPVGYILQTTTNVNPGTYLYGTWNLLTSGKLITGSDKTIYAWTRTG